jgi:hypothetical protein
VGLFENMVLGRIFGHRMDEVTSGWRKCHDEFNELYTLHQMLLGQSIREECDGSVLACLWGKTNACKILVGKPQSTHNE